MKVAIVGSRSLQVDDLQAYMPAEATEIVSGGARGVDMSAKQYALEHGLHLTEFLPDYERYGRRAPLVRNRAIIAYADIVLAFWDGRSRGTAFVISNCEKMNVPCRVYKITDPP